MIVFTNRVNDPRSCSTWFLEVASIQFSLVLIIMGMMLLEHVIACGWFGVGQLEAANGMSWLIKSNLIEVSQLKAV